MFFSPLCIREGGVGGVETSQQSDPLPHSDGNGGNRTMPSHDFGVLIEPPKRLPLSLFGACSFASLGKNRCC